MLFTEDKRECYLLHFCAEGTQPISRVITPVSFDFFLPQALCCESQASFGDYLTAACSPIKTDMLDSPGHPEVLIK